jgi:predicted permease
MPFDKLWQDLRYGGRTLLQNPGFAAVAVLSLALGIGANTAIFSLIDVVMLRQLPVKNPQQLVFLSDPTGGGVSIGMQGGERTIFTYGEYEQLRDNVKSFSGMFASESDGNHLNASINGSAPEEIHARLVTENYFQVLGLSPILGRAFSLEDAKRGPGGEPFAIVSYDFWQKRFGLDPYALGKTIRINQTVFTVVGVAPPGFQGETVGAPPDIYLPMMMEPQVKPGRLWLHDDPSKTERVMWLHVVGRLKDGATIQQAQANVNVVFGQMLKERAGPSPSAETRENILGQKILLHDGSKGASNVRDEFSEPLLVLMAVVGLVLLIACANVANLLLARATARRKEMAVRLAMGASRARLVGQLLTESLFLSTLGGAAGVLFASWANQLLLRLVSQGDRPLPLDIHPDARILAFTAAVSILTGILFGLAPALRATRLDINPILKENARGVSGERSKLGLGRILVVVQVALSVLLLVGAGLFLRSLGNLQKIDLGYNREKLLLVRLDSLEAGYKGASAAALYRQVLDRIRVLPGVRGVALSENGLFSGTESGDRISVEGFKPIKKGDDNARFDQVGPGYFSTLGIPVLLGREIGPQDAEPAQPVCVIDETMAKFYFGSQNPIGRHVTDEFPDSKITMQIVGVVRDSKQNGLRRPAFRRFYTPFFHALGGVPPAANFEIRTFADPSAVAKAVRAQIREIDPAIPLFDVHALTELLDNNLVDDRLIAQLSAFFGLVALLLASIGLYGVLAYAVARRTSEIGIRMALGAGQRRVIRMILGETLLLVAAGLLVGVPAALACGRLVASKLFGLKPSDPASLAIASAVMILVALLAAWIPARRASRVDPLIALRYE